MSDPIKEAKSAPLTDLAKVGQLTYGEGNQQVEDINESLKQQIQSLEDRYAQPNWWKVAAGFAKPQLGGFIASLGSASEAMGENLEQQRAMGIPLAKMRTELAVNNAIIGKNKEVSDEIRAYLKDPANKGQLPSDTQLADWRARSPDAPAVKSLDSQVAIQQKARQQAIENIKISQSMNEPPNPADLATLGRTGGDVPAVVDVKPEDKNKPKEEGPISSIPLDPSTVKPGQKVDFGFMPIRPDQTYTPMGQAEIKAQNDEVKASLKQIAEFGNPINYQKHTQNIDQLLSYASKGERERELLKSVTNKMASDSSLMSAIAASANEGLHLSWNGYQASAGAPVKTFVNNLQDKDERRVAQMLVMALDNANYVQTQLRGGLKGGLPVSEANVLTAGLFSRDLDYNVLMHGMLQLDNQLGMYKNIYEGTKALKRNHAQQLTTYAPEYQIYNSKWMDNLTSHHQNKAKNISSKYNAVLAP